MDRLPEPESVIASSDAETIARLRRGFAQVIADERAGGGPGVSTLDMLGALIGALTDLARYMMDAKHGSWAHVSKQLLLQLADGIKADIEAVDVPTPIESTAN